MVKPRKWALIALPILLLCVLLLVYVLLRGSGFFLIGEERDETWERIQREGVMRVGVDASYPPFENVDEAGNYSGYDIDLTREIGRRLGVRVQFINVGFDGLYDALYTEKFDVIISALPYDPLLTQDVAYSYSYFNAGQLLVVREDEEKVRGVEDLAGKRVGVELGSGGDVEGRRLEKRMRGMELVLYRTPQETLQGLKGGEVDAAIADALTIYQFLKAEGGVKVVGPPVTDESYVMAVRPDSSVLLAKINGIIVEMRGDGFLERLRERWF